MRPPRSFETSSPNHPVTRHLITEERKRPQANSLPSRMPLAMKEHCYSVQQEWNGDTLHVQTSHIQIILSLSQILLHWIVISYSTYISLNTSLITVDWRN